MASSPYPGSNMALFGGKIGTWSPDRPKKRTDDNIQMDLRETGCDTVKKIMSNNKYHSDSFPKSFFFGSLFYDTFSVTRQYRVNNRVTRE
jgi:hypothetical protein